MASQAEIDLLVDATRTLPDLERNLARIISIAERNADDIDVHAAVDARDSLDTMQRDLANVIRAAENGAPDLDLVALLDQQRTLTALRSDLNNVITQADNQAPDIDVTALLNRTRSLRNVTRDLNAVVTTATRTAPDITVNARLDGDADRDLLDLDRVIRGVGRTAASGSRALAGLGVGVGALSVATSGALPLVAGLVGAVQSVAPAAAVGTSAILTMQLATNTLKIAMIGVEDAVTEAFKTDNAEEFAEALDKLAPEARSFVKELRDMSKELRGIQQRVQNNVFRGFDDALESLAKNVVPSATRALDATSRSLNRMALGAAGAASEMSRNGTLGQALESATLSLQNLERLPGQATQAFAQLAAASGPSMERITRAVQGAADGIAGDLARAFETGALEESIDTAIDVIAQLGRIGGNIFSGLGNIIGGVTSKGEGLFFILEDLSEAFEQLTSSREFQAILSELVLTGQALVDNVLPLLKEAFIALAPVIEEIGPPLRDFINEIGPELIPVIKELAPVLMDLAVIFREQMPLAIELAKTALQILNVALKALHVLLSGIIIPIVTEVARAFDRYGGIVSDVTGDVDTAVSSLAGSFATFQTRVNGSVQNVIGKMREFAGAFGRMSSAALTAVVQTTAIFGRLPGMVVSAVAGLGSRLFAVGQDIIMGLVSGMSSMLGRVRDIAREIANTVAGAVTDLLRISSPSRVFISIGRDTVAGFVEGIRASLPELAATSGLMGTTAIAGTASFQTFSPTLNAPGIPAITVQIGDEVIYDRVRIVARSENELRDKRLAQGVRR